MALKGCELWRCGVVVRDMWTLYYVGRLYFTGILYYY